MQNEAPGPAAASASSISTTPSVTTSLVTTSSTGRPTLPHISVYAGIPGRQTAQVIQQALHRQPSTAAQYLQQMYAAQQQHLMLQTAALQQQQQLSNTQLQRLAGVQQVHATIVAGRQSSNQIWTSSHQTCSTQTTVNPATPPAAAQIISRVQSVSSTPTCIPQQAVLLGNASSLVLTASQAQMYLRAQMLIFTPTAAVATVQSAASSQSATNQQSASAQVQNLAICSQQGAHSSSQLQGLHLKQMSGGAQVSLAGQLRGPTQGPQGAQLGSLAAPSEGGQKGEGHLVTMSRSVMAVSSHPLISPAYAQIQTHQFLQQQKQQQFVFQQQRHQTQQLSLRGQAPVLHTASIHSHSQAQMLQALAIQPRPKEGPVPVLPKPFVSANVPSQQATIFHSTVSPQILTHNRPSPVVTQTQTAPLPNTKLVQMAAVNLQIQPTALTPASQLVQDSAGKELPTSEVVTENSSTPLIQQPTAPPILEVITIEQCPSDPSNPTTPTGGKGDAEWLNAQPGAGSLPVMTSGNGNNAPMVTGSTPQNGESKLPQAIVKPQILTHFIEGFVIQEGAEPFPVERPLSLLIENLKKHKQQTHSDSEKTTTSSNSTTDSEMEDLSQQELKQQEEPTLTCELCGRVDFAYNFKRSKRFCSTVCAKRYNVGCTKRMGLFPNRQTTMEKLKKQRTSNGNHQNSGSETKKQTPITGQQPGGGSVTSSHPSHPGHREFSQCLDMSSYEGPPSPPLSAASSSAPRSQAGRGAEHMEGCGQELPLLSQHFQPRDPAKWNVEEVYEFICSLPGCLAIAEEFRSQEIDGQSLLLLKEDHLMGTMNIKLGPALKLFAEISMLRDS
ncbi:polyhomeotic-like protein 2 isoform X1 [Oncorhynchus tshawytscha]|uniref:polyhomeotic-like protein 2 isoform X1 n=1 Tax=Oncorhynchus tshawytscha TaxID=74940 RepID=UPI000D0A19DA|nr:polyhomeotic-like protein 2 isoform X1 [Oncorhynchus tshawytscha]